MVRRILCEYNTITTICMPFPEKQPPDCPEPIARKVCGSTGFWNGPWGSYVHSRVVSPATHFGVQGTDLRYVRICTGSSPKNWGGGGGGGRGGIHQMKQIKYNPLYSHPPPIWGNPHVPHGNLCQQRRPSSMIFVTWCGNGPLCCIELP